MNVTATGNHNAELEREFTDCALEQAHPLVRAWRGDALRRDIQEATRGLVALVTDDDAARQFAETVKLLSPPAQQYKMRLIEMEGRRFLARIDFPDRSGSSPFVAIYRASAPPGAISDMTIQRRLAGEFAPFAPRRIRFYHPAHVPVEATGAYLDQRFLVGLARDMAARPEAPDFTRVALHRPADLSFYPRYVEAYNKMFLARPQMRGAVRIESEETLAASHAEGLLYEISVGGLWAGIVAARYQVIVGVRGAYMVEILLDSMARGQRLGPAVHRRFAANVAATDPSSLSRAQSLRLTSRLERLLPARDVLRSAPGIGSMCRASLQSYVGKGPTFRVATSIRYRGK